MAGWHGFSRSTPPLFAPEGGTSGALSDALIAPLLSRIGAYDPKADSSIIEHAFHVAAAAHATQRRDNGDPYISHPVAVADILADYRLDTSSIATALLHDVIEDTGISLPELEAGFGPEIAGLVDGVTKLTRLELQSDRTKQAENFRKLVLAMSKDIRVLLVKLADRLHNMRTIHFVTERDRAVRIARETMEIYAPLAERIGMERVKVELQNRAFAVIDPEAFDSIQNRLNFLRGQGADVIEEVRADLMRVCRDAGIDTIEILGREKSIFSIWEKMQRRNVAFEQLSDIMAFRIIVPTRDACYVALGAIHAAFPVIAGRFKDYISTPKANLYRSLHTGVTLRQPRNQKIEVQIRTAEMHDIAENGVAAHWFYKQGAEKRAEPSNADLKQFRWVQDLLEILENSSAPDEFLENTKLELYQDQVFCFTPKGQLIQLPRGATSVDFAYAVHSQIGDACVGARINGRLMPLRYALQNGDQVEILTARGGTPSASWERFVVTGKARARIRRFLAQQVRVQHRDQGKAALARAFRQDGVDGSEKILETILKPLKIASLDDLYVAVATSNLGAKDVVHAAYPALRENRGPRTIPGMLARPPRAPKPSSLPITGLIPGMEIHYAGCCHPLPGDPIAGIIATGKGVTIHTKDCLTLETFSNTPERFIDVDWDYAQLSQTREGPDKDKPFTGRVSVIATHAPNALANLANAVAKQNASLESLKIVHRQQDFFECLMDIEVRDLRHLSQVIAGLRAAGGVTQVDRAKA
ncbi:MAG TPA: bifunctional (p)ppGpp synthetase/guanosine-3',5'-bis(diphosphate) 3'-pyrophosphohydrolase [Acidiphilium sp.]|nr:MAG: bifunctional (p)ppGpp synthetase/guanosine-3',5'-bis(diphosphate) 3'-pyrophosphohydrolase [Acidiphilium sp. 21-60-14]OYV91174.1 MAG: bifunctional (p)ppGpp synthetase/guanosine-3',5'-bis(diphosphate) 3'-pyrophosphohydrolase [Acidiphilium sp. 37-60-79]HQT87056.1 bifunctional (p)ppGpp synthetase/guanosine-3',5'-bis(diphosphate) 3'-pyrophosphohydrolase [Acidiphilium sp.]HQU22897.1 bifunctional (p)ppGpp synthetase/guanosine-3',5'-bis(diphosphate) 3'-pyrophosphohydrolase [Acidiphilium sp.]